MVKIDLPVLKSAKDSFIKGLKAYVTAYNDYDFINPDEKKREFFDVFRRPARRGFTKLKKGEGGAVYSSDDLEMNLTFRDLKTKPHLLFDSADILNYKDSIIFYHHCIEQLLKEFLRISDTGIDISLIEESNFPRLLQRCKLLKLTSITNYEPMLRDLNNLRNTIYHGGFIASFIQIEMMLGSTIIRFFNQFLKEMGYSLKQFLPNQDEELHDALLHNAEQIKEYFDEAGVPIVRFNRNMIATQIRWLETTNGTKENPSGLAMEILNLKHKYLLENGIEGPPCPVCSNMIVIGYDYLNEEKGWDGDELLVREYAECAYCGLYVLNDFLVDFCEHYGYDIESLEDEVKRKINLENEDVGEE